MSSRQYSHITQKLQVQMSPLGCVRVKTESPLQEGFILENHNPPDGIYLIIFKIPENCYE